MRQAPGLISLPWRRSFTGLSNGEVENRCSGRLIILRHGQSEWNAGNDKSCARFTGWKDIPLTELGRAQAVAAARTLKSYCDEEKISIDTAVVSLLQRSQETLNLILHHLDLVVHDQSQLSYPKIPVTATWRLNERHYGALVGQSKAQAEKIYSKELLAQWRYSWWDPPPPMDEETLAEWRTYPHCQRITFVQNPAPNDQPRNRDNWTLIDEKTFYRGSSDMVMPASEAFGHVLERVLPFWNGTIAPRLAKGQNVLLVGHANSVKAMLHILDPKVVNENTVKNIKIPNTTPLVYEMEEAQSDQDSSNVLPGGIRVVAERPTFMGVDAPLDLEARHALRATWLERAWIPATPQGDVLHSVHQTPQLKQTAMMKSLQSIVARTASIDSATRTNSEVRAF